VLWCQVEFVPFARSVLWFDPDSDAGMGLEIRMFVICYCNFLVGFLGF
jgi:hypothetical protein